MSDAPRCILRHILCDVEVSEDLKRRLRKRWDAGIAGRHPLQAWITVKERSERLGKQHERITRSMGTCQTVYEHELMTVNCRAVTLGSRSRAKGRR